MTDTIIIGGGAAGCFAAVNAARFGKTVLLFEKNEKLGRKLRITGKGRCNVTNNSPSDEHMKNIPVNPRFLYSAFSMFSAEDTKTFFEELGVPLKTERGNRVFPVSDKADDIADALAREMKKLGVKVIRSRVSSLIIEDGLCCGVISGGKEYRSGSVLIALAEALDVAHGNVHAANVSDAPVNNHHLAVIAPVQTIGKFGNC